MENSPITRFQRIIEDTDWDNELIKKEPTINRVCLAVVWIAGLFLGLVLLNMAIE